MSGWFMAAAQAYMGPMGAVAEQSIWDSLKLMGQGMLGILVVMTLIWLVIFVLNRATKRTAKKEEFHLDDAHTDKNGRAKRK